jgi:hypothetical protein
VILEQPAEHKMSYAKRANATLLSYNTFPNIAFRDSLTTSRRAGATFRSTAQLLEQEPDAMHEPFLVDAVAEAGPI